MTDRTSMLIVASRAARLSAAIAAVGVVFLVLMYVGFLTPMKALIVFGPLNDVCVLTQYALTIPIVFALHRHLSPTAWRGRLLLSAGLIGCIGTVVFQGLLLLGIMSFRQQVGYVSAAVLLVGVWAVLISRAARSAGFASAGTPLLVATFMYFGYPLWALRMSRWLHTQADTLAAS